jgi:hypothetical protein
MKKVFTLLVLVVVLSSCNFFKSANDNDTKKDTIKDLVVGADKDENGCLASAGYTWSKLNKECVRAFSGIQLTPINKPDEDDATLCAYLLFDEKADNVELFLPNEEKSIILHRESEGNPWIYKNYQLIPWKGYVLKIDDKPLYSGDGEIGNNVTGSDDGEEISNNPTE